MCDQCGMLEAFQAATLLSDPDPMTLLLYAFGLSIETELPIPGALSAEVSADAAPPDMTVRYGEISLTESRASSGPYRAGREGLLFEKAGVAGFLCAWGGCSIRVEAAAGVSSQEIAEYLIATALPAALWLRGEMMLHAGAAVLPGQRRAVALPGRSGAGKSTLLKAMVDRGATMVAEDSLCVRESAGAMEVSGLPACLHLRDAGELLEAARRMLAVPSAQRQGSAPLQSIVLLEPDQAAEVVCTRLTAAEAMVAILHHRHRSRVPELAGLSAALLPRWRDIACAVPVYSLKFPRSALSAADCGGLLDALTASQQEVEG